MGSNNIKTVILKTCTNAKNAQLLPENTWIAINEEDTDWYIGKVKSEEEEICEKKMFIICNIMTKVDNKKSKHFQMNEDQNNEKKIFKDDIIRKIGPPKELKRPKNVFSIKEFNNIENLIKKKLG